jgi:hypothetical protein
LSRDCSAGTCPRSRPAPPNASDPFPNLLGQHHCFPTLSCDTLKLYACQGDPDDCAADQSIGRHSDITKSANLYLDSGPFDYPVTVIDAPGTNDPCLTRDEITRRPLDSTEGVPAVVGR